MKREKIEKKKLTVKKRTVCGLDHQANLLEKGEQKDVKAGLGDSQEAITNHPVYCAPAIIE